MKKFIAKVKQYGRTAWCAAIHFNDDRCMKLGASLSYYTLFSIGPLLVVLISLAGYFAGEAAVRGQVFDYINNVIGNTGARQVEDIVAGSRLPGNGNIIGAVSGAAALILGATKVFTEIQDSINFIWNLKSKPQKGWLEWIRNRFLSFSLIISCGFVLLVSLVLNAVLDMFSKYLQRFFTEDIYILFYILNFIIILTVISVLFAIIFKVLPDGKISWKDTWPGAILSGVLFIIGKYLISLYVGYADVGASFGTAASVVLIMVWVYYTSLILFYGAEFTRQWCNDVGKGIQPNRTAVFIVKREAKELPHVHHQEHVEAITEKEKEKNVAEEKANDKAAEEQKPQPVA